MNIYELNKIRNEVSTLTEYINAQAELENIARPVSKYPSIDKRNIKKKVIKD